MKNEKKKGAGTGTGLVIGIAVIYILLGLAMLLIPNFQASYIVYAAGIVLLVFGIILIVKYFLTAGFRELGRYDFSGGVLCVIISICTLIRANTVAEYFPLFLGVCILLTSIIKLQNAVALKSLEDGKWMVFLIIALVFLALSLIIILDLLQKNAAETSYIYAILVGDGAVNLAETLCLALVLRKAARVSENPEPAPVETQPAEFAQEPVKALPEPDPLYTEYQPDGGEETK